ncbi:MAG TPA: TonB-dependent receptor [Steroidobacteraceae bacterium]|nr:TonB-dependent receptor [Steroidobacteraceae bacterium]
MNHCTLAHAIRVALITAGAAGAGLSAAPSAAQDELSAIVVTGSRIARTELEAAIPTISVDSDDLMSKGYENLADVFVAMPQFTPSFGASRTQSTFSGVATSGLNLANLRNLGGFRTLTLINGRRLPGGTSTSTSVDFNTIPSANIERIEVQTGGASAVYGADAVAGVVNIVTKKDFSGIEIGASYGEASEGDNRNPSAYVMFGGAFGEGGRALFTAQYDEQSLVTCADREFCADDFVWFDPANPIFGANARSGVGLGGRFFAGNASYTMRNGSITDSNGDLIPFVTAIDGYNRNAQRDIAIPTERTMIAAEVEYPIAGRMSVFGEVNYGNAEIDSRFEAHPFQSQQPGSLFGGSPTVPGLQATIPIDNPFVPQVLRDAVLAANPAATAITWWQRFAFFDDRGANNTRNTTRGVVGLKGDLDLLGNPWNWEVSHVYGRTRVNLGTEGLVSTEMLYHGLRVEPDPASPGQFRCVDAGARSRGCIPINPFGYTEPMLEALRRNSDSEGTQELGNTVAWISGSAFDLPAGSVRFALGVEQRELSGYLDYDPQINGGTTTGNQIQDVEKSTIRTQEAFVETLVPLLRDLPGAHALDFEGAFRTTSPDFSVPDRVVADESYDTWKYGLSWAPIEDLRFRVMQARAVRSPNPGELSGIGQTFGVINDPCTAARRNTGPNPTARAANCTAAGVPADYAPGQIIEQSVAGLTGGNANLAPEEADTLTYGLVWTPSFVEGLSMTIDRFDIEVDGVIDVVARQTAANFCYDFNLFCGSLTRGTSPLLPGANYVLTSVNQQLQNVAKYNISGIDLGATYGFSMGRYGDLKLNLSAVFYDQAEKLPLPGAAVIDLKGSAGGDTADSGYIDEQVTLLVNYRLGKFSAMWDTRYIGSAEMAYFSADAGFAPIGAKDYHALRFGYDLREGSELYVGVTNLFDRDPPLLCSGCSGTQALDTIPGYYDVFGRSWYAGVRHKF